MGWMIGREEGGGGGGGGVRERGGGWWMEVGVERDEEEEGEGRSCSGVVVVGRAEAGFVIC